MDDVNKRLETLEHFVTTEKEKQERAQALKIEAILDKATRARNGYKFQALWKGKWKTNYVSVESGALALLRMLYYWSDGDVETVIKLFKLSKMCKKLEKVNAEATTHGALLCKIAYLKKSDEEASQ